MNRSRANLVALLAAILVGVGALLSSFVTYLTMLWGISAMPRSMVVQDPLGWALRPAVPPLAIFGMLLVCVLLVGLTWLFVRLVAGSALPGRGAAVFFGTWGALIVASMVAGLVRAIIMMITLRIPTDNADLVMSQFQQFAFLTATWAVTWGWIVALVAALVHRASSARRDGYGITPPGGILVPPYTPSAQSPAAPASQYSPAPRHTSPPQYSPAPEHTPPPQHPGHSA